MESTAVIHHTFAMERTFRANPERVFAAFSNPKKKRRWFAEGDGFEVQEYTLDFRVGGSERAQYKATEGTPIAGSLIVNETRFLDIVPNRRIVLAYTMGMGDKPFSASLNTFELLAVAEGTKLVFTEQAAFFEGSDGPAMREQGWAQLLDALGKELTL